MMRAAIECFREILARIIVHFDGIVSTSVKDVGERWVIG